MKVTVQQRNFRLYPYHVLPSRFKHPSYRSPVAQAVAAFITLSEQYSVKRNEITEKPATHESDREQNIAEFIFFLSLHTKIIIIISYM